MRRVAISSDQTPATLIGYLPPLHLRLTILSNSPTILKLGNKEEEAKAVGGWLAEQVKAGILPHEIGLLVRSVAECDRALAAIDDGRMTGKILDEHVETVSGHLALCTMHLAKGLEFRRVAVMACDDEIIPSQGRIQPVGDDADLQEVYDTGATASLCRLYSRQGSTAHLQRGTGIGIPRRP